jgi:hypothetical protein
VSSESGSTNLIMGFCTRWSLAQLTPFIASLRRTTFAGDTCLLVDDVAAETIDRLRALGLIVERAAASAQQRMSAMSSRYFSYLDFLIRRGEAYANIMLADPSATVFAADPFDAPLPADIVYVSERQTIDEAPFVRNAVLQAYGEAVAHNIRDCTVSNPSTVLGTRAGILRYLTAMTHQLAGRTTPISGAIDQGVHNYVVHMRPLAGAWLDSAEPIAFRMDSVPNEPMQVRDQAFVPSPRASGARDAVVAFYQRQRDAGWLQMFLESLRCVSDSVDAHCVGDFDQDERAILARFQCTPHAVPATELVIAENVAHFYLDQALDRIASGTEQPDQVLVLDNVRAVFPRDPFLAKTIGLSVFCEGPTRIGESDYNRDRLGLFAPLDEQLLRRPVVSSMVLRGRLGVLREFYRRMFIELVGRADLLKIHKVVQGVVNKLCHGGDLGFPVIAHPNGAEVHFEFLASDLAIDARHGVRVGGTVPGVVLSAHQETPLMLKLRIDLNLPVP